MKKFQLTFEKISGLTTDGARAMVGLKMRLVAFVKKEMDHLSLDTNDLIACLVMQSKKHVFLIKKNFF